MSVPIHVLSLGAGVQSSTLALMAAAGEVTPMPTAAIFADTQAEPASVYRWLDWLEKQLPFPMHRVTAGSIVEDVTTLRPKCDGKGYYVHSGIPAFVRNPDGSDGIIPRQCMVNFMIEPIRRAVRELAGVRRGEKAVWVIQWIGISLDEVHRMKPSREPWQQNRWPLVDLGHEAPRLPALDGGARVSQAGPFGVFLLPLQSNAEWRWLRDEEPEYWQAAIDLEVHFGAQKARAGVNGKLFFHRSRVPLSQVDLSTLEERGQGSLFGNECEGMCGV